MQSRRYKVNKNSVQSFNNCTFDKDQENIYARVSMQLIGELQDWLDDDIIFRMIQIKLQIDDTKYSTKLDQFESEADLGTPL